MKPTFTASERCNASLAKQTLQEKASNYAKKELLRLGRAYPMFDAKLTPEENYERLNEYSTLEASYIQEYIAKHSAQQVIEQTQKEEVKRWAKPYYDD